MATANTAARKAKIADLKSQLRAAKQAETQASRLSRAAQRTYARAMVATDKISTRLGKLTTA
jgi:hypothetical protein